MSWPLSARDFVVGIVVGVTSALFLGALAIVTFLRTFDLYSLGHWKLNLRTPLPSMWMNLGFWKSENGEPVTRFDEACLGLLREILKMAGILECTDRRLVSVLDLGFGCGDQTLALARLLQPESSRHFRYVGLTLDASQRRTAVRTLRRELASSPVGPVLEKACFRLYRADAAKPDSWSPAIQEAVQRLADPDFSDPWLLALDCLYHFSPSREPIFRYAARTLRANAMAFDLLLNEQASGWNKLLVHLVGLMMSCPMHTFLTENQYRAQMVECGFEKQLIIIRDISDDVFAGVASYLRRQEEALSLYGISIDGFKLAGCLFDWFDRLRVVKAVIVIGRTSGTREPYDA